MPLTEQIVFTQNRLNPFIVPERAVTLSRRFQANQTIQRGQPLGLVTTGVNAVQTLTVTGSPTGGNYRLQFGGFKTATIAHNAAASVVQAALEALVSIGSGNVAVSGSAGGPYTITFQGAFAASPQALITVPAEDLALTGGSSPSAAVANTTTGVVAGGLKAWVGELLSSPGVPTVSAVSGGTGFGDGTNSMPYVVTVTFFNEAGETTPSQAATVLVTNTNRTIRVGAYNGVNANIQGARYYVNGSLAGQTLVSSGNIAQTDLTAFQAANTPQPDTNTAFATRDGSHVLAGFALCDIYTDVEGRVTFGRVTTGMEQGQELTEAPLYIEGFFRVGDLAGITSGNGPQLARFGRFISGAWNNSEGIYRLGLL